MINLGSAHQRLVMKAIMKYLVLLILYRKKERHRHRSQPLQVRGTNSHVIVRVKEEKSRPSKKKEEKSI